MPALRTRVYIDGYNLYYGCLRNTAFKWLDVLALFETQILPSILYRPAPGADPATAALHPNCAIKYFTAKIIERAAKSEDSVSSQAQYHNALTTHCGDRLSFVMGHYSLYKANQQSGASSLRRRPERRSRPGSAGHQRYRPCAGSGNASVPVSAYHPRFSDPDGQSRRWRGYRTRGERVVGQIGPLGQTAYLR